MCTGKASVGRLVGIQGCAETKIIDEVPSRV